MQKKIPESKPLLVMLRAGSEGFTYAVATFNKGRWSPCGVRSDQSDAISVELIGEPLAWSYLYSSVWYPFTMEV